MHADLAKLGLDPEAQNLLERFHFDERSFWSLRQALKEGRFPTSRNRLAEPLAPPMARDLLTWPEEESAVASDWSSRGEGALQAGRIGIVILNGGMATRFGGVVKGVVPVIDGKSFLGLSLERIAKRQQPVSVFLMNSFATEGATQTHLEENGFFRPESGKTAHGLPGHLPAPHPRGGTLPR